MYLRVLFIDDEKELVEDLPPCLNEYGIEASATTDLSDALDRLRREQFHVVLLDIAMPVPDFIDSEQVQHGRETGLQLVSHIRKLSPSLPLVAFTVLRDPEIHKKLRSLGVSQILCKPQEVRVIAEALRNAATR